MGTGGHAPTAPLCLGPLQLCPGIWPGFPSSPLLSELPLATGHHLLHVKEENGQFLKQRLMADDGNTGHDGAKVREHSLPQQTSHVFLAGGRRSAGPARLVYLTKARTPI